MRIYKCSDQNEIRDKLADLNEREEIILVCEPLKEQIDIECYLSEGRIFKVICGGDDTGDENVCCHEWILSLREQCRKNKVWFEFRTTGNIYLKNGKRYVVPKELQMKQALKAGLDYDPYELLFNKLHASKFRNSFYLNNEDKKYVEEKGYDEIEKHARRFIENRLAPEKIPNDGKQTPMRGHPVFKAQHGTGTCCRGCLEKWHHIRKGHKLTEKEENYVISVIMRWIITQKTR